MKNLSLQIDIYRILVVLECTCNENAFKTAAHIVDRGLDEFRPLHLQQDPKSTGFRSDYRLDLYECNCYQRLVFDNTSESVPSRKLQVN